MPKDATGKFHLSTQRAQAADRKAAPAPPAPKQQRDPLASLAAPAEEDGPAHQHLRDLQSEMPGKHMLMSNDGMGIMSHQIGEDGQVQGPTEHNTAEEAMQAMDAFFREEAQEPQHGGGEGEY